MRAPNKAILRNRHVIPTTEDLVVNLNGATVFSKFDMNQGYHQLELVPQSSSELIMDCSAIRDSISESIVLQKYSMT